MCLGVFMPIKTTLDHAPDSLPKYIHCNCKTKSKNTCSAMGCTCWKNELQCLSACTDCWGQHCKSQSAVIHLEDVDKERNVFDLITDLWDYHTILIFDKYTIISVLSDLILKIQYSVICFRYDVVFSITLDQQFVLLFYLSFFHFFSGDSLGVENNMNTFWMYASFP